MNREIKFRGKDIKTGEWVYGDMYGCGSNDICIIVKDSDSTDFDNMIACFKASVGQYTGIKDKNNKEIYEDDILKVYDDFFRYGVDDNSGIIEFKDGSFKLGTHKDYSNLCWEQFEVIGNIYENTEL